jgi:UPF0271 protein
MKIDINADIGEGFGYYKMGDDEALMDIITSANIACGFHAGDPVIMDRTIRLAAQRNIDIGAHVGFPDMLGFGRRVIQADPMELSKYVVYQLGALAGLAKAAGCRMTHMSFHGALGNMAAADDALADPLVKAIAEFDPQLIISVSTNTAIERAALRYGMACATAFLADRAYDDQGALVSRKLKGAVIEDKAAVLQRVVQLLNEGCITSITGNRLEMKVKQILVHGDTAGAVALARSIREAIQDAGGKVVPVARMLAEEKN